MPVPKASGSTSTTRSNSSPFACSGVSARTRDVGGSARTSIEVPITAAMPSECVASHASRIAPSSDIAPCATGMPFPRTDTGTLAVGIAARMTGSASAMTSRGVR